MKQATTARAIKSPGVMSVTEIYRSDEFRRRAGFNDFAWRAARKAGLPVVSVGRKLFVRGTDWEKFLGRIASGEITLDTG